MKGALLWRRILNEMPDGDITRRTIVAPLIVDSRTGHLEKFEVITRGLSFPFPEFWVEGSGDYDDKVTGIRWGALVTAIQTTSGFSVTVVGSMLSPDGSIRHTGVAKFTTDVVGDIVPVSGNWFSIDKEMFLPPHAPEDMTKLIWGFVCDVLVLLGCKNVGIEPRDLEKPDRRRAEKRNRPTAAGFRYHVLVVRPPGSRKDSPAQEIGVMPRHICRGHFAEYGPEFGKGLLFGKLAGRFYVPPHMKGKTEHGTVEKDYEIGGER